jgi:hypothetical protein
MQNITKKELKEYTINRLIFNDIDSDYFYNIYLNEKEYYEDFKDFLNNYYDNYNEAFKEIESKIIYNINNNIYYLD